MIFDDVFLGVVFFIYFLVGQQKILIKPSKKSHFH